MESREIRLKRLKVRADRRGIKEMDILLGGYVTRHGAALTDADLTLFEALLVEGDQEVLAWVTGLQPVPEAYRALLGRIIAAPR